MVQNDYIYTELEALEAMYDVFEFFGSNLDWWPTSNLTDACAIPGVECNASHNHVVTIDWPSRQLFGTIPTEVGVLTGLERLALGSNELHGTLPMDALYNLKELQHLEIYRNRISGPLPVDWSNMGQLKRILLQYNDLTGPLTGNICDLSELHGLDLFGNMLTGTLPDCLAELPRLRDLQIYDNAFTGTVPTAFCDGVPVNEVHDSVFGCNGIACPMYTYSPGKGRQQTPEEPCLPCPTADYLGSSFCPTPSDTPSETSAPSTGTTSIEESKSPSPTSSEKAPTVAPSMRSSGTLSPTGVTLEPFQNATFVPTTAVSWNETETNLPTQEPTSSSSPTWEPTMAPDNTTTVVMTISPTTSSSTGNFSASPSTPTMFPTVSTTSSSTTQAPTSAPIPWIGLSDPRDNNGSSSSGSKSNSGLSANWVLLTAACLLSLVALMMVIRARRSGRRWWYRKLTRSSQSRHLQITESQSSPTEERTPTDMEVSCDSPPCIVMDHRQPKVLGVADVEGGLEVVDSSTSMVAGDPEDISLESDSGWNDTLSSFDDGSRRSDPGEDTAGFQEDICL